ncbi:YcxB family protein [Anaerolentibacter hominis]|uniref:YcxB family protein n=1 Tax=Anaerolentibacter hominis TaxID=3079009 RepID=UPI0031B863EB
MEKEFKFSVNINGNDMTRFMFRHAYTSFAGRLGLLLSTLALVMLIVNFSGYDTMMRVLMAFIAAMFLVIQPVSLFSKAHKQVLLNPMFKKPLNYTFNGDGILVEQEGEQLALAWNQLRRVIKTKKGLILYLDKIRAYILPDRELGGKKDELYEYIQQQRRDYREPAAVQEECADNGPEEEQKDQNV